MPPFSPQLLNRTQTRKVGSSERIKQYEDKLSSIDAWSTLHAITLLREDEFEHFRLSIWLVTRLAHES